MKNYDICDVKIKDTLIKYLIGTIGLATVALGIALSIISNLGTSPLSCPAYVLSGIWGLSVGEWTVIINTSYIIVQLAVMRNLFKLKYLLQIIASLILGYLIDAWLFILSPIHAESIVSRIMFLLISCGVSAIGVSLEMYARAWMLSAEMTVYAFMKRVTMSFGNIKMIMDSTMVALSLIASTLIHNNPFGFGEFTGIVPVLLGQSEGVVISAGTLISAVGIGYLMKFTDPLVERLLPSLSQKWGY